MKRERLAERRRLEIFQLCHGVHDSRTLRRELLQRLQRLIPFDYAYFSTTDPATQLSTSSVLVEEPPAWCMSVFLENEFLQDDFNKFSAMFHNRQSVGVLSASTKNELHRSPRYRNMLVPMSMGDELRAVFVADGACWGTLCLHREQAATGFTAEEAAYLLQLTPHITDGLRKSLLLDATPSGRAPDEPGVLILTDDFDVVAATPAAEYWLGELAETEPRDSYALPIMVRSVATGLKAIESGLRVNAAPKMRFRTRSGQWLVLYASRFSGDSAHISIIFETAKPIEIAPLMMQAYQLTKRESRLTQCVLLGWSTAEIAANLHISTNTVQDHLKAIFEKVDVSSRGELAARIFAQQYHARFSAGAPLDVSGQFKIE